MVTQSHFNIPLIEQTLCSYSFPNDGSIHRNCLVDNCTDRGKEVCLVDRMKRYLDSLYTLIMDKKFTNLEKKSDWFYLNEALAKPHLSLNKDMLDFFSGSRSHRLRYKNHRDQGIALVERLIKEQRFVFNTHPGLWDAPSVHQEREHLDLFQKLCQQTEQMSNSGIYRLYELTHNRFFSHSQRLPSTMHLAVAFAFGHGMFSDLPLESIGELVAKFHFYEAFAKKVEDEKGVEDEELIKELVTEQNCRLVSNLWKGFMKAASKLQPRQISSALNSPRIQQTIEQHIMDGAAGLVRDRNAIFQLKSDLSLPRLILSPAQFVFDNIHRFRTLHDAGYHPFKHADVKANFQGDKILDQISLKECADWNENDFEKYAETSLLDYYKVINEVIATSTSLKIQPSQFDHSTTFTFEVKRKRTFKVIVSHHLDRLSYILTCF